MCHRCDYWRVKCVHVIYRWSGWPIWQQKVLVSNIFPHIIAACWKFSSQRRKEKAMSFSALVSLKDPFPQKNKNSLLQRSRWLRIQHWHVFSHINKTNTWQRLILEEFQWAMIEARLDHIMKINPHYCHKGPSIYSQVTVWLRRIVRAAVCGHFYLLSSHVQWNAFFFSSIFLPKLDASSSKKTHPIYSRVLVQKCGEVRKQHRPSDPTSISETKYCQQSSDPTWRPMQ